MRLRDDPNKRPLAATACIHLGQTLDGPPTPKQITHHKCCWCMGTEGATECHANGHAEAVALATGPCCSSASTSDGT